jgi:6-phosphogluconolactonase
MRLTTVATPYAVAARAAETLALLLRDALERRGVAHIALTGGSSAAPVYERLTAMLDAWDRVHLWWGDERCVPPEDEQSNFRIAVAALIEPAQIPMEHVHRMRGELGPDEGARAYAAELGEHVENGAHGMPVLDVVDLGLGPDGHVASLFPNHPALRIRDATTAGIHDSPKPPPQRITLTLPTLHAARRCVVHTAGADKHDAVRRLLGDPSDDTPASLLNRDRLTVIVDDAAGGGLEASS